MASADFCHPIRSHRCKRSLSARWQTSRDKHSFFRPAPAGSTTGRSWEPRVSLHCASSPTAYGLAIRFLFVRSWLWLGLLSDPTSQ